jgi:hypothetical protein
MTMAECDIDIDFDSTVELPIQFGPFKIVDGQGDDDLVLTDRNETVYFGFDKTEAPDLQTVADRLVGQLESDGTTNGGDA